ncbi:MAG TPA: class I SAM-dependent methyltransferase [Magnetospirillum sp.]|jgi:ubiquinone/menaquinone biosynthesis C-methylase UbiE|nr:class I SAM-dependent methyltransferase [Magnetospirillum sp.]
MDRRRNADVIVETLPLEGKRVVDVGCGDASLARHMAKFGARVLGVECSPRQLSKARAAEPHPNVSVVEGVGQALPAASAEFDYVVFFNSLHHVPLAVMGAALDEAARVLKPGGQVYVSEPIAEGPFFQTCRPVDDETEVRASAYQALKAAGKLRMAKEFRYLHTVQMRNFDAFRDRLISANMEREAHFDAMADELRALFESNGTRTDEGWSFDQPMRVNVLEKI